MNQKAIRRLHAQLRRIRLWYLLIPAVLLTVTCVFALRQNNLKMLELRQALYAADKSGQGVNEALNKLRSHVYGHMNTDLTTDEGIYPPIQLKYTYERLSKTSVSAPENSKIYSDAQAYCEQQNPNGFSGRGRIPCIEEYISNHGGTQQAADNKVPAELYMFDFVSPTWSPDLAGFSMLFAAMFWLLLAIRSITGFFLRGISQ